MASCFIALPLISGEAFLLETTHKSRKWAILIDSGQRFRGNPHPLVAAIRKAAPKVRRIDVVVCTHQDQDHSNGFRTFADEWYRSGGEIGEFWLPGRWAAAIPQILYDPFTLVDQLWAGALSVAQDWPTPELDHSGRVEHGRRSTEEVLRDLAPMNAINDTFSRVAYEEAVKEIQIAEIGENRETRLNRLAQSLGISTSEIDSLQRSMEESEKPAHAVLEMAGRLPGSLYPVWWIDEAGLWPRAVFLFREVIDTAKVIAAIAQAAIRRTIPIRWFDFGQFEQSCHAIGGISDLLTPVNAVELRRPPSDVSKDVIYFCLRLSQQNVESLVFLRHETADEPGALFIGDSRLCFGVKAPTGDFPMPTHVPRRRIVVTAPHHGSRVNDEAYRVVQTWLGGQSPEPIYVRNGGHWKQTLDGFLKQKIRRCAQCRQCKTRTLRRRISLNSTRGNWTLSARRAPKCP